jgi:thiosulfate dehydrogenase [quinone] large subunit
MSTKGQEQHQDFARSAIASLAILPLRLFLGVTFLYAGIQKLLDPAFFSSGASGFIGEQLRGYVRSGSPLSPVLSSIAIPHASLIGMMVALAEMWIGLATLTGLVSRISSLGGMLLSLTFYLTASWTIHPYFLGPDLPYIVAWLTLCLLGPGPFSADRALVAFAGRRASMVRPPFVSRGASTRPGQKAGNEDLAAPSGSTLLTRVAFIHKVGAAAILAAFSTGIAATIGKRTTSAPSSASDAGDGLAMSDVTSIAGTKSAPSTKKTPAESSPRRAAQLNPVTSTATSRSAAASNGAGPTATASTRAQTADSAALAGYVKLGNVSSFPVNSAARYIDPISGDPGILVHLPNDNWVAYDAVCPHAGCTVRYQQSQRLLRCPCHGALFDPADRGTAVSGPTNQPLEQLRFKIESGGDFYAKSQ